MSRQRPLGVKAQGLWTGVCVHHRASRSPGAPVHAVRPPSQAGLGTYRREGTGIGVKAALEAGACLSNGATTPPRSRPGSRSGTPQGPERGCGGGPGDADRLPSAGEQVSAGEMKRASLSPSARDDGPDSRRPRRCRLGRSAGAEFDVINHRNLLRFPKTNTTGGNYSPAQGPVICRSRRARYKSKEGIHRI